MENKILRIQPKLSDKLQDYFPFALSDEDAEFFLNWVIAIGIGTIESAFERYPHLTIHDLFVMSEVPKQEANN